MGTYDMKKLTFAALLLVSTASFAQTIIQDDFETVPSFTNDGRDGWRHNFNRSFPADNYSAPLGQGDKSSRVLWKSVLGTGALVGHESGAGAGDWWVAADKFTVNGGNFSALTTANLSFRVARLTPTAVTGTTTTAPSSSVVTVRFYGEAGAAVEKSFAVSAFPTGFYTASGLNTFVNLSLDLKDATGWTGIATGTYETVMPLVTQIVIDFELVSGAEQTALDDVTLSYDAGAGAQTVVSDFETPASIAEDGRQGWIHNGPLDGFTGFPQGDVGGIAYWSFENIDTINNNLINSGMLLVGDPAQGIGDAAVAPQRYNILGGRFDMVNAGTFSFDYVRFLPNSNVTTSAAGSLDALVLATSEGYLARYRFTVAELNALTTWGSTNFYQTLGLSRAWPFAVDLTNRTKWVISRPSGAPVKSLEEILANVAYVTVFTEVRSGTETNAIDNVRLEFTERAKITGAMAFNDRVGKFPTGALIQFLTPGTETVVWQAWAKRDANGNYVLPQATPSGTYDLAADPGLSFMRTKKLNVSNPGTDVSGVEIAFRNGDVDNSGEVDAADIDLVIASFGSVDTDPNYAANSDVDGSGEVDAADIDTVIASFGSVND